MPESHPRVTKMQWSNPYSLVLEICSLKPVPRSEAVQAELQGVAFLDAGLVPLD